MTRTRYWPTKKLLEVLDHPLTMGVDGKDFGPYRDQLQDELNLRYNKIDANREKSDNKAWQAFEEYCTLRRWQLRCHIEFYKELGGLSLDIARELKREIELITDKETCPFTWAIFENNHN